MSLAALPLLIGCGGSSGDLIAIEVSGGLAGGTKRIVVQENGQGRCNAGKLEAIPSDQLIDAREIERELESLAEKGRRYGGKGADRRRYIAHTNDGAVRWVEGEPALPEVLPRAQLLALRLERQLCR